MEIVTQEALTARSNETKERKEVGEMKWVRMKLNKTRKQYIVQRW